MPWRRLWQIGTLVAGTLLLVVAAAAIPGSIALDNRAEPAGSWGATCRGRTPRHDRPLLSRCARVSGRVAAIRHDDDDDVHLIVLARLHVFVVKLEQSSAVPRWGSTITAIGPLVRARGGLREVQAWRVTAR